MINNQSASELNLQTRRIDSERVAAFVYARMDSSRLPGKAFRCVAGIPLLQLVISRLKMGGFQSIHVLTSGRSIDNPIAEVARECDVSVIRGPLDDVVARTQIALDETRVDAFARVNGDSPFVDTELLQQGLARLSPGTDMVTNVQPRTYPYGVSVEWITAEAYRRFAHLADKQNREHVTAHLYQHREQVNIASLINTGGDLSSISMVIDTADDLLHINALLRRISKSATTANYLDALPFLLPFTKKTA